MRPITLSGVSGRGRLRIAAAAGLLLLFATADSAMAGQPQETANPQNDGTAIVEDRAAAERSSEEGEAPQLPDVLKLLGGLTWGPGFDVSTWGPRVEWLREATGLYEMPCPRLPCFAPSLILYA
jgi:hypothetical protein